MLEKYQEFLKEFDSIMEELFKQHKRYIKCKKGCSICCEQGDYPFSQVEFGYLTQGFLGLPPEKNQSFNEKLQTLLSKRKNLKAKGLNMNVHF